MLPPNWLMLLFLLTCLPTPGLYQLFLIIRQDNSAGPSLADGGRCSITTLVTRGWAGIAAGRWALLKAHKWPQGHPCGCALLWRFTFVGRRVYL
ncbi:MAG: hypothetical protein U5S82_14085 [Gammaproteobacteria bacterium]|nr:hypothetical protein [Gammaproteobacteria bacterium]